MPDIYLHPILWVIIVIVALVGVMLAALKALDYVMGKKDGNTRPHPRK